MPGDVRRFLIDFLPAEQRILRRDGLHLHHIRYWSDELRWLWGEARNIRRQIRSARSVGGLRRIGGGVSGSAAG